MLIILVNIWIVSVIGGKSLTTQDAGLFTAGAWVGGEVCPRKFRREPERRRGRRAGLTQGTAGGTTHIVPSFALGRQSLSNT